MIQRIFLFALLFSRFVFSQSTSTGVQVLKDDLSVNIDTGETTTTLTLTGPSDTWFAVGFGDNASGMFDNTDVFRTNGTTITDAQTEGQQLPPADESQDWTLVSNTVSGDVRTIVATRANDTGDERDFVFSNLEGSIDIIWAYGNNTIYAQHTSSNRGATTIGFTLSSKDFKELDFDVYPNPILNNLTIQLPSEISKATLDLYDLSGRKLKSKEINTTNNIINIEEFVSGIYLLKIKSLDQLGTKRIIKK